jgi:hypothetical protein
MNQLGRALLYLPLTIPLCGQTKVDLRGQSKNVDFSTAPSTRPTQTGTVLPALCQAGALFYKLDAAAGQNLYGCTATNSWTLQGGAGGGGGGGTSNQALLDCGVTRTSGSVLTVFAGANSTNLCIIATNSVVYTRIAPETITISSGTLTVRSYLSDGSDGNAAGSLVVCNTAAGGISVSAGLLLRNSCGSFPPTGGTYQIFSWAASASGLWDSNGVLLRPLMSGGANLVAGTNLTIIPTSNGTIISSDTGVDATCTTPITAITIIKGRITSITCP